MAGHGPATTKHLLNVLKSPLIPLFQRGDESAEQARPLHLKGELQLLFYCFQDIFRGDVFHTGVLSAYFLTARGAGDLFSDEQVVFSVRTG